MIKIGHGSSVDLHILARIYKRIRDVCKSQINFPGKLQFMLQMKHVFLDIIVDLKSTSLVLGGSL